MLQYSEPQFPVEVGRCVYCDSTIALQDEHVIPFGLSGEWVLQHASCAQCAMQTSRAERALLRSSLMVARTKLGPKTRRPRARPHLYPLVLQGQGRRIELELPHAEHPGTIAMPKFCPLKALNSESPERLEVDRVFILHLEPDKLRALAARHKAEIKARRSMLGKSCSCTMP